MYQPFEAPLSIYTLKHETHSDSERNPKAKSIRRPKKHVKPKKTTKREQTGSGKKKSRTTKKKETSINTRKTSHGDNLKQIFALRNFVHKKQK